MTSGGGGSGGPPAVPGKLRIHPDGRLTGPAQISYNNPWPMQYAEAGVTGRMRGAVLHTSVSTFEGCIDVFNAPSPGGSAHFVVDFKDGRIHQFVPIGKGYETYHAYAANMEFYGIETSDDGDPRKPIRDDGLWAWAQLLEFLSRYAGFPLREMKRYRGEGLGYHREFWRWNLSMHTCPGASWRDNVRRDQRAEIIRRAQTIRNLP